MNPGTLYADDHGAHPYARASWVAQATWHALALDLPGLEDAEGGALRIEALMMAVPPTVLAEVQQSPLRATASWLPWRDSGVALFTLVTREELVLAAMDLAGTDALAAWEQRNVCAVGRTDGPGDFWPSIPIDGLPETARAAGAARRLSAKELVAALSDLRALLRTPTLSEITGTSSRQWSSITLNVCQPPSTQGTDDANSRAAY